MASLPFPYLPFPARIVLVVPVILLIWEPGFAGGNEQTKEQWQGSVRGQRIDDQQEHSIQKRQILNQCNYPCKCPNREIQCKAGVNIIRDGCECCYVCARTQGDLCNYRDKCDEDKGLYCDFTMGDGDLGICRAKDAAPCEVDGIVYKDGEQFKPSCNRLCSCQNGNYACTPICPQEERRPSSVHCKDPQLVAITGRCCKEWVCPDSKSLPDKEDIFPNTMIPGSGIGSTCQHQTTAWSSCSVSCDMGISVRFTNDNEDCTPTEQRRLCYIRPCDREHNEEDNGECRNIWRDDENVRFEHDGCTSAKQYRPKYCSNCNAKRANRCCVPEKTKTNSMEWECADGKVVVYDFMWIKSCVCSDGDCHLLQAVDDSD